MGKCPNCDEPINGNEPLCPHCDYQLAQDADGDPLPGHELTGLRLDENALPNYRSRLIVLHVGRFLCVPGVFFGVLLSVVGGIGQELVDAIVGVQLLLGSAVMYYILATCIEYTEDKRRR
jgi:hypothetical protein